MICPACGLELVTHDVGGVVLDACDTGCGGVWFDNFELQKVASAGAAGLCALVGTPAKVPDLTARRDCPRCENQATRKRFFSRLCAIEVDECPQCAGLWLDGGELRRICDEIARSAKRSHIRPTPLERALAVLGEDEP